MHFVCYVILFFGASGCSPKPTSYIEQIPASSAVLKVKEHNRIQPGQVASGALISFLLPPGVLLLAAANDQLIPVNSNAKQKLSCIGESAMLALDF